VLSNQMTAVLALLGGAGAPERFGGLAGSGAIAAAAALGVDGIAAGVGTGPTGMVLAWGRQETSAALEEVQFTLGQGPSVDVLAGGAPILVADLAVQGERWPAFTPAARELGVRALFAFPLRIGAISVGALLAHRAAAGPLSAVQLADALGLADAVTVLLLRHAGSEADATPGAAADTPPGTPCPGWAAPSTYRAQVHQATGMISVQLNVDLAEALARLRAYAYAQDRRVADVADDVVARRLRFDDPET
jgi:hypothetical protein